MMEEKMMHKILPLIGVSGLLVIVFLVIMIILSLIKRSREMLDKSSTHIGFNQGLDQVWPYLESTFLYHKIRICQFDLICPYTLP